MAETGVKLSYGVHEMMAAAVGHTVAQVRDMYSQIMNLPGDVSAVINGKKVSADHIIKQGEEVEFVKEAGVKGAGR